MDNLNFNENDQGNEETRSLKDYILLIRNNLKSFIMIAAVIFLLALAYAIFAKNIYKSTVTIRLTKQQQNILQTTQALPEISDFVSDRFVANEIEVINSYRVREKTAKALIDTFESSPDKSKFYLIKASAVDKGVNGHKTVKQIAEMLKGVVSANQKRGIDVVEISAESHSPYEAALIANVYADQYDRLNLEEDRNQLTTVRKFLEKQSKQKLAELNAEEDSLTIFQEKGGIVSLDAQSTALINQLAQLDAERDNAKIDLKSSNEVLAQYRQALKKQDPQLADYLEGQTSQAYITALQQQIAELQTNRDLALANKNPNIDVSQKVKDFDKKLGDLKQKLNDKINDLKASAYASSPDQVKDITQELIEEEVKNHALASRVNEIQSIIDKYDVNFNKLPKTSIQLARYERKREALQQLYSLVEQNYQEAIINELSQPGNVEIIDNGRIPDKPDKPNRMLIVLIGLILGLGSAFGYVMVRDYFDDTVKSPEDIEKKKINLLAWIPEIEQPSNNGVKKHEFIVSEQSDSSASEAFRALRTRMQFSRVDASSLKIILVTSAGPQEGKTVISTNLAGSFAQSSKKTLLIDCDLRKPRVHSVMGVDKTPGLVDYLFHKAAFEDVIRTSGVDKLNYITSGTLPPNPAEILESKAMRNFLTGIREQFDVIIIDSAPIIAVTDSEILSRLVDGTLLVVSADKTEVNLMTSAVDLIKNDRVPFLGTVLNNFRYKNGYGYYYKYYYYYSGTNGNGNGNGHSNGKKVKHKAVHK